MTLQFRDRAGHETKVSFEGDGNVVVTSFDKWGCVGTITSYSKDSPIAAMYQNLLHNSREVGPNLYQVIGAW